MAQQVRPDDGRLDARFAEIDSPAGNGKARGCLVRPPGALQGFHNHTTPRSDEAAAKRAWQRTLGYFKRHLRG